MIRFIKLSKLTLAAGIGFALSTAPAIAKEAEVYQLVTPKNATTVNKSSVANVTKRQVKKVNYSPASSGRSFVNTGVASYYGPGFHGRLTANGERFNQNALTAAHRTLPFGTRLKVTNLNNGRSVVVRVNDRGPYVGNRVIDLSVAAAQAIGSTHSGTARVNLEVVQ